MHPFFADIVSNLSSSAEQPASFREEGSAAQPASHGEGGSAEQPVPMDTSANRQKKRSADTTSESVEQPISKRRDRCATTEWFAACTGEPSESGARSSGSAAQPAFMQQQSQRMRKQSTSSDCGLAELIASSGDDRAGRRGATTRKAAVPEKVLALAVALAACVFESAEGADVAVCPAPILPEPKQLQ